MTAVHDLPTDLTEVDTLSGVPSDHRPARRATAFPSHGEGHPNLATLEQLRRSGRGVLVSSAVRRVRCR